MQASFMISLNPPPSTVAYQLHCTLCIPATHSPCVWLLPDSGDFVQAVLAVSLCALPKEFSGIFTEDPDRLVKNWHMFFCVAVGLWGGLIIGLVTEYYTSNRYQPVQVRPVLHCTVFVQSDELLHWPSGQVLVTGYYNSNRHVYNFV